MVLQPDNRAEERAVLLCIQHTAICSGKRGRRKQCHYQGAYAYRQPAEQKRIKPWLFRIVRNECYSMAKLRQRTVPIDEEMSYPHEAGTEYRVDVENALARLPQEQREAITLYYICDHSVNDIAEILEVPSGTVKSRLSRARQN